MGSEDDFLAASSDTARFRNVELIDEIRWRIRRVMIDLVRKQ